jgi:adenylosuccinate lyase
MPLEPLSAVSSIDGRYRTLAAPLAEYFSEFALIRARVRVECTYLVALSGTPHTGMRRLSVAEKASVLSLGNAFSLADAQAVKEIEKTTNHDVKAVEYFLKQKMTATSLADLSERVHFALTSEDVNSVAYGLLLRDFFEHLYLGGPLLSIATSLESLAREHAATPILARTHGQPASPTTFGKEMRVFLKRLRRQVDVFKTTSVLVKFGGATGNWSAHMIARPEVDWQKFARDFVEGFNAEGKDQKHYMRLELNDCTTQIEPHDTYAEYFDYVRRINTILIDFSQDMWRYISDGWIVQKAKEGEVGSSAMPHKVNPIDFENAEGNLGVANALFEHFSRKLPISRLQRDLSDSTVERAFGTAFAHTIVAYRSLEKGLGKISVNADAMRAALQEHPEVLSEAIQTVLRAEGAEMPYEKLKELTRGKTVSLDDMRRFIDQLDIPADAKKRLQELRPEDYTGLAARIAKRE